MAYRERSNMDLWDIIRRWHDRQGIRAIARSTGFARKTVQGYTHLAVSLGLSREKPLPEKETFLNLLGSNHLPTGRTPQVQNVLLPFLEELHDLLHPPGDEKEKHLKAKTVFTVLCERHPHLATTVSYSSYKRFVRTHKLSLYPERATCRMEVEPGEEVQIDYGQVGKLFDPLTGRRRVLYAFIATLAHSRLKYVELTFNQDQRSFVSSHVRMFAFFGGVPARVVIDNLKSGVIKPDLYDPSLNRAYREMSEYYGCFIDPARVRHPKDKGKVERDVQTVREAVHKEIVQHPGADLAELNRLMKHWSLDIYGQHVHGSTGEKPFVIFQEREQPALRTLQAEPFEPCVWKKATVHPDHYIQFERKAYSVPHAYVGKIVWIKASEHIVKVYFEDRLIKQHLITARYRHTDFEDFPDNVRAALDTSVVHIKLLERAQRIGPVFHRMIEDLVRVHAYLNLRRAQALVSIAEETHDAPLVESASNLIEQHMLTTTPEHLRQLLAKLRAERSTPNLLPLSEATSEFVRDISYFIYPTESERSSV